MLTSIRENTCHPPMRRFGGLETEAITVSEVKERLAYLQGLANGYKLRDESREGQILVELLGVLDEMATELSRVEQAQSGLEAYVESLDSDLNDLEEDFYGADEEEVIELTCPNCGLDVEVGDDDWDEEGRLDLTCPDCGEPLPALEAEEGRQNDAR